jgi:alanine dehydrogenase
MLILSADEVRQCLPMSETIAAMKLAHAAFSAGRAEVPLRLRLAVKPNNGLSILMPAFVDSAEMQALAVKIVSLFENNPARGLPFIHAAVLVLDPQTGSVEAILEGGSLTAIRTGATSGAATDLLARPAKSTLALFGAGRQARTQLEAVCSVRKVDTVWVYSPDAEQTEVLIAELSAHPSIPQDLRRASHPEEAARNADIICTATTSDTPVFPDSALKPGTHINAVGAYTPQAAEVPEQTIARALLVVDSLVSAKAEAGEIAIPLQKGLIHENDIAELGQLVSGQATGRTSDEQLTVFKSVGLAVQDAFAGQLALDNARKLGLGTQVPW